MAVLLKSFLNLAVISFLFFTIISCGSESKTSVSDDDVFIEDDVDFVENDLDEDYINDEDGVCLNIESDFCQTGSAFCLSNAVTQCEILYDENGCPYDEYFSVKESCSDTGMQCIEAPESLPVCDCPEGLISVGGECVGQFECPDYITVDDTIKPRDTIASFNALHLGWDNSKDFAGLACVINHFDIIGVVEVESEYGLQKLVSYLEGLSGEEWGYHISPYDVGRTSYKEFYGYVWRKNVVNFESSAGFYEEDSDEFMREPYAANFSFGDFNFTFILLHVIYGDSEDERKAEVENLIKVYSQFQLKDEYVDDIIIAGDFNLSADDDAFTLIGFDKIINAIPASQKTSIGDEGLSSAYDNIFLSESYTTEYEGVSGVLDFAASDYFNLRISVSDHVPVWIEVKTSW